MPLYKQDPDNTGKQIPDIQGDNRRDRANNPQTCSFHKTPNYVVVNTALNENCGFFFGNSASFYSKQTADERTALELTGSEHYTILGKPAVGTTLNIHPTAWSGSSDDAGSITFVYKSGLSTGGI
jgi:hypothetical protein